MTLRVLVAGEPQNSSSNAAGVVDAAHLEADANGPFDAFLCLGAAQHEAGFYSEFVANWDQPGSWGDFNSILLPTPGDNDIQAMRDFGVDRHVSVWQADRPPSYFPNLLAIPSRNVGVDAFSSGIGNDRLYQAVVVGTFTGDTEPVWPTTYGQTVTDGDFVWQCVQPGADFYRYMTETATIDPADPSGLSFIWTPYTGLDGINAQRRSGSVPCSLLQSVNPNYGRPGTGTIYNPDNAYYGATLQDPDDPSNVWRIYMLNAELEFRHYAQTGISLGSPQSLWLQQDIAQWGGVSKIVCWHAPRFMVPYDSAKDVDNDNFSDIFRMCIGSNTRLFLWSDAAQYQRFDPVGIDSGGNIVPVPLVDNVMRPQSSVVVVTGNGGGEPATGQVLFTGSAHARSLALRPLAADLIGGGGGIASTAIYYGATICELFSGGFSVRHIVGADAAGNLIQYDPTTPNLNTFDSVIYSYRGLNG